MGMAQPHSERPEPTRDELFKAHSEACNMLNGQSLEIERLNKLAKDLEQAAAYWQSMFSESCRLLRLNSDHLLQIGNEMKVMVDGINPQATMDATVAAALAAAETPAEQAAVQAIAEAHKTAKPNP